MPKSAYIALLRGVNVGGRNRVPMPELRSLCEELGWRHVQSYIQSGNLVFEADGRVAELEGELERVIERSFGLSIPVIVRAGSAWSRYVEGNPFPEESARQPNLVMLALSKAPPRPDAAAAIEARAAHGERVKASGDALWTHFPGGSGRSKLTPALLDRLAGSPVTTRNWRTVLRLAEMAPG